MTRLGTGAAGAAAPIRFLPAVTLHLVRRPVGGASILIVVGHPFAFPSDPYENRILRQRETDRCLPSSAKMMTPARTRHAPEFVRGLTCQGWGTFRGIKGGSATLARSYRGPDNVAGPILGQLNTAVSVVSAAPES